MERRTELALRALRILEAQGGTLSSRQLAPVLNSSGQYLPQVLGPLVRAGWLVSEPGPTGGYQLAEGFEDHSLLELVEVLEGPTDTATCVLKGGPCGDHGFCALHEPWLEVRSALEERLARIPIFGRPEGQTS
jgi:Rrf2 family iron-sulfur cluster assembly transcriptional regulator